MDAPTVDKTVGSAGEIEQHLVAKFLMQVLLGKEAHSVSFNTCPLNRTCSLVHVTSLQAGPLRPYPPAFLQAAGNYDVFDRLSFQALQKLIEWENVEVRD